MSKLKQLQEAAQAAAKAARETAEKADREGRALTDAERTGLARAVGARPGRHERAARRRPRELERHPQ